MRARFVLVSAPMRYALIGWLVCSASHAWAQPAPTADPPVEPPVDPQPAKPDSPPPSPPARKVAHEPQVIVEDVVALPRDHGFRFGSYGRIVAGSDMRGGKPEKILIVAHGPRIVEPSYLELDFSYGFESNRGVKMRPVVTLAFDGTLFHDTGDFDAHPALRNMYLDAQLSKHVSAWVGSRMYRGDDIYLFDFWPLDDQNTVGGGFLYRGKVGGSDDEDPQIFHRDVVELAGHLGVNRLDVPFQFQQIDVANPVQGATTVIQLNRQRMIASATATYFVGGVPSDVSMKFKLHGEFHALPSGSRKRDDGTFEALPSDSGMLVGAEVSLFGLGGAQVDSQFRRHVNLFTRYAKGLAAFDELAPPTSFGPDLTTQHASELTFGTSSNWDSKLGNVMLGALSRRFIDATSSDVNPNNGWEYAVDARPLAHIAPDWFVGADVSYQARFPRGLNPNTLRAEDPAVFQIAPMAVFSPMGPSSYDRPQLRFVYRAAHLNEGALDLYVPDDPRHAHAWVHFIGVQAEWWFNSSTYR